MPMAKPLLHGWIMISVINVIQNGYMKQMLRAILLYHD